MISNLCNYASIHKKCPASCIKEKEILSSKYIYNVFNELSIIQFDGTICFHIYNEPMIDSRLFWFIEYIKTNLPYAKVEAYSNGYCLNEVMLEELQNVGVDILCVTGYGEKEYSRLLELNVDIAYSCLFGCLDERLDYYVGRERAISNKICMSYFTQLSIYSNGDIGTCCLDYNHPYNLGNIKEKTLEGCLNSDKIIAFQKELLRGNRNVFSICKNCNWLR